MNPAINDWVRKRVWIIGASSGIGAETARLLMSKGAHVALSARRQPELEKIAAGYELALTIPLDIVDHSTVLAARDLIIQKWQQLDLVLIVAGGYQAMQAVDFDLVAANDLIDLNIRGVLNCLDVVLPILLKQNSGGLGIVGSVAGYSGLAHQHHAAVVDQATTSATRARLEGAITPGASGVAHDEALANSQDACIHNGPASATRSSDRGADVP